MKSLPINLPRKSSSISHCQLWNRDILSIVRVLTHRFNALSSEPRSHQIKTVLLRANSSNPYGEIHIFSFDSKPWSVFVEQYNPCPTDDNKSCRGCILHQGSYSFWWSLRNTTKTKMSAEIENIRNIEQQTSPDFGIYYRLLLEGINIQHYVVWHGIEYFGIFDANAILFSCSTMVG